MGTKTQKLSNVVDQIVEWQSVFTGDGSTGLTAVAGRGYFIDTTSGTVTVTLPTDANSKLGDTIVIRDYAGTFATNNVTITSTAKISEADADGTLSTNDLVMTLTYVNSTKGWVTMENEAKAVGASDPAYISATGGTITTSGDFKIHTFTGDGCFVVSCGGNSSGNNQLEYLVVAGGGGGGGCSGNTRGGAGGGGFRFASPSLSPLCYPAKPLVAPEGITASVVTYPITVGAGGTGSSSGAGGSNSIFSTITSAGGGATASAGGSGGGQNGGSFCNPGGAGNTPPVSPPQGQPGGANSTPAGPDHASGGGGGAISAGSQGRTDSPTASGNGGTGAGLPSAFGTSGENCGSFYYFSGGGGGGGTAPIPVSVGSGGLGGGGCGGGPSDNPNENATANTGGGGGGSGPGNSGGNGGKGIVIIRYKFQN